MTGNLTMTVLALLVIAYAVAVVFKSEFFAKMFSKSGGQSISPRLARLSGIVLLLLGLITLGVALFGGPIPTKN